MSWLGIMPGWHLSNFKRMQTAVSSMSCGTGARLYRLNKAYGVGFKPKLDCSPSKQRNKKTTYA
eukprot:1161201-Pelagomonas_calceolata.AAC.25